VLRNGHYELHTGLSGKGAKIWIIVSVGKDGLWSYRHDFDTSEEALSWLKWAV